MDRRAGTKKRIMQRTHRQFAILGIGHDRDLDLGSRDHFDIDVFVGQHLEHPRRDAGVGAHPATDNRNLGHLIVIPYAAGSDLARDRLDQFEGALEVGTRDREGHIGAAVGAGVLDNHVHDYSAGGDRTENPGRQPGTVLDRAQSNLALVLVQRYARDQNIFHRLIFLSHPSPRSIAEARPHHQRYVETFGYFDRAILQNLGAQARQFEHFIVGDAIELERLRAQMRIAGVDAIDVGVNLAQVGIQRRRQSYRCQVRGSATQSRDIAFRVDSLVAGHHNDILLLERLQHGLGIDRFDARTAMIGIGRDAQLMGQKRNRRLAHRLEPDCQQRRRHLFARGHQHVGLAQVRRVAQLVGDRKQPIGLPGHRGNHRDYVVACRARL